MSRPEPVEAYRLCDLPVGTKYRYSDDGHSFSVVEGGSYRGELVYVVEWPQRVYDGIPADDLDTVLAVFSAGSPFASQVTRIRAAIEASGQDQ